MPRRRRPHRPLALSGTHWRSDGAPKVRYATKGDALVAAAVRSEEAEGEIGVYRCDFCRMWHLGRTDTTRGGRDE